MIYLDAAATSGYGHIENIIADTITNAMKEYWQNPSSLYATNVKEEINKCRAKIAKYIGAEPEEIYFTSGASESNNWAIRGFADEIWKNTCQTANIIATRIEHKSIMAALENETLGAIVRHCDVDKRGRIDLRSIERLLLAHKDEPILVSVGLANNEIGVCQDIKTVSDLVHKHGGLLHVDATQAIGHIPINVEELGIDMLSASGHKISPVLKGIGFLYKKNCINIQPLIYGNQESGLRGGTENTFGIIGLSKALEHCDISQGNIDEMCSKRDYFIGCLECRFGCRLNGHPTYRLPNNINVTFPQNITGEALLYTLDLSDIKVSVGSACNSQSIEPSYVLTEIGLTNAEAMRTVRFSLPNDITYEEIDYVIAEIDKAIKLIET